MADQQGSNSEAVDDEVGREVDQTEPAAGGDAAASADPAAAEHDTAAEEHADADNDTADDSSTDMEHGDGNTDSAAATASPADPVIAAAEELSDVLKTITLPLPLADVAENRTTRLEIVNQLDDYLIPRLRSLDAPLLTVVGGSTGAGKSTLINSLLQADITQAGVVRPTTKAPILVHHPDDAAWFADDRILPSLARVTGDITPPTHDGQITTVHLVSSENVPQGMALLDAPDIDSVVTANRDLAKQLLAAADLWLFVTTAARYADNVPWQFLRSAGRRGASVAVVLDRVPSAAMHEVKQDLAKLLAQGPLEDVPLFGLEESDLIDGRLHPNQVAEINTWLNSLAADEAAKQLVIRRTLSGACEDTINQVSTIVAAQEEQQAAAAKLENLLDQAFSKELDALSAALIDGSMLRGEVLTRWHDFLGTSAFTKSVENRIGWFRDKVMGLFARSRSTKPLGEAVATGVTALVVARIQAAGQAATDAWAAEPGGEHVLSLEPKLGTTNPQLVEKAERMVRDWQRAVLEMVREQAKDRIVTARVASLGINALSLIVMIVVFSGTAFIPTGAEVAAAAGTTIVGQRFLEAIFGDEAVRRMTKLAHNDLLERASAMLAADREVYLRTLQHVQVDPAAADALAAAQRALEAART